MDTRTKQRRAALHFCNSIREQFGMPRRTRMLSGDHSGWSCPIARTISSGNVRHVYAGTTRLRFYQIHGEDRLYPSAVEAFVRDFDRGEYPELEKAKVA